MTDRSPSTHLVTALDLPFRFLRDKFPAYAPTVGVLTAACLAANVVQAFLMEGFVADPEDPLRLYRSPLPMLGMGLQFSVMGVAATARAVCVANALAGRDTSLAACFAPLLRPRLWAPLLAAAGIVGIHLMCCCYGASILLLPLGLILPAALDEGLGLRAIARSVEVSMWKVGPDFFDRPGWKVVAVRLAEYLVTMALGSMAAIPMFFVMGGAMWEAIASGHPELVTQSMQNIPMWVTMSMGILGTLFGVFPAIYGSAATFQIYRDAVARHDGADLERLIAEKPVG